MAGGAVVGGEVGAVEAEVEVAGGALGEGVLPGHREPGLLAVVEVDVLAQRGPRLGGVAGLARNLDVAVDVGRVRVDGRGRGQHAEHARGEGITEPDRRIGGCGRDAHGEAHEQERRHDSRRSQPSPYPVDAWNTARDAHDPPWQSAHVVLSGLNRTNAVPSGAVSVLWHAPHDAVVCAPISGKRVWSWSKLATMKS